jgi:uncharacterized membrane protein
MYASVNCFFFFFFLLKNNLKNKKKKKWTRNYVYHIFMGAMPTCQSQLSFIYIYIYIYIYIFFNNDQFKSWLEVVHQYCKIIIK